MPAALDGTDGEGGGGGEPREVDLLAPRGEPGDEQAHDGQTTRPVRARPRALRQDPGDTLNTRFMHQKGEHPSWRAQGGDLGHPAPVPARPWHWHWP